MRKNCILKKSRAIEKISIMLLFILLCALLVACNENNNSGAAELNPEERKNIETLEETKEDIEEDLTNVEFVFSPMQHLDGVEEITLLYSQRPLVLGGNSHAVIKNNMYLAKKDGKYGLLDISGNWQCTPEYAQITYYYDYFLEPDLGDQSDKYSLDNSGNIYLLEDPYVVMGTCSDPQSVWCVNQSRLMLTAGGDCTVQNNQFTYDGTIPVYQITYSYEENYGDYLPTNNNCYAVCTDGVLKTDFVYTMASEFSDGLIAVEKADKWGYLDQDGNEVIPCLYEAIRCDNEEQGIAASCTEGYVVLAKDNEYALVDKTGTIVIPFGQYEVLTEVQSGRLYARKDGTWGIISLNGEELVTQQFDMDVQEVEEKFMFKGVMGSCFELPKSFEQNMDAYPANGYLYEFYDNERNMMISVSEVPFEKLPLGDNPHMAFVDYYEYILQYASNCWHTVEEKILTEYDYVIAGNDAEKEYYYMGINSEGRALIEIIVEYPIEQKNECQVVLEDFLNNFEVQVY